MELFKLVGRVTLEGTDNVNNELNEVANTGESSESRLTSAFKKIGGAVVTYFAVDKIINFGKEIANTAASVSAENSAFAQIMGNFAQEATTKMESVAKQTGVMSTRLTPYMTSMTAKFKGLGFGIDDATTLATNGLLLASDAAAFWDRSLDDTMSHLNSFINGSYEGGEAIGLFANDTQMAQYAVRQGVVESTKAWASLDEATKQATRLEYAQAMLEASGAVGQAAKESEQHANVSANLTEKWRQFKAEIGEPILQNIVLPAMEKLSKVVDKLSEGYKNLKGFIEEFKNKIAEAKTWCEEHKTLLTVIGIAIGGITTAIIAYNAVAIAKTIADGAMTLAIWAYCTATTIATTVTSAFGAVMAFLTSPITLIILGITALIAIVVLLWNKCDWFRNGILTIIENIKNFFVGLWNKIQEVFNGIMEVINIAVQFIGAIFDLLIDIILIPWNFIWVNFGETIMSALNTAKEWLMSAWEFIKSVFTGIWKTISTIATNIWTTVSNIFNNIKNTITNIVTNIKDKVSTIFTNIKDGISSKVEAIKEKVTTVFDKVKSAITTPIEKAKETVKNVVEKIKGFFDFKVELPKIKLPHFGITPKGWKLADLMKGDIPKLGIDWYAKAMDEGMILDEPTIFGINSKGIPMAGGEAGSETVVGTNSLMNMISKATAANKAELDTSILEKKLDKVIDTMQKLKIYLDDREVGRFVIRTVEKEVFN